MSTICLVFGPLTVTHDLQMGYQGVSFHKCELFLMIVLVFSYVL